MGDVSDSFSKYQDFPCKGPPGQKIRIFQKIFFHRKTLSISYNIYENQKNRSKKNLRGVGPTEKVDALIQDGNVSNTNHR